MQLTIEKDLFVEMRDGIKLATDVYRPAGDERHPVVMLRLPYSKDQPMLLFLAGGFLMIVALGAGPYSIDNRNRS